MNHRSHRSGPSGYTLVEILIVVAILGVVGALAFDAAQETIRTARTSAAGSEFSFFLLNGRQNAVTEHDLFFVTFQVGSEGLVERLEIRRDDGSGVLELENDNVVEEVTLDQIARLGDGRGSTTSLPEVVDGIFAVGFGPSGEAVDPTDGSLLAGFVNISGAMPQRGNFLKYAAITIAPSGAVVQETRKEHV